MGYYKKVKWVMCGTSKLGTITSLCCTWHHIDFTLLKTKTCYSVPHYFDRNMYTHTCTHTVHSAVIALCRASTDRMSKWVSGRQSERKRIILGINNIWKHFEVLVVCMLEQGCMLAWFNLSKKNMFVSKISFFWLKSWTKESPQQDEYKTNKSKITHILVPR